MPIYGFFSHEKYGIPKRKKNGSRWPSPEKTPLDSQRWLRNRSRQTQAVDPPKRVSSLNCLGNCEFS